MGAPLRFSDMQATTVLSRNAVRITGAGRPMVLVHGFGCDQKMWDRMVPSLEKDHQVIRYDLTGMGASQYGEYDRERHGKLDGHAADLIEIIEALETKEVVAVGHSVGAIIIGLAAIERPDLFSGLVMVGPSPCYIDKEDYRGGFTREEIEGLLSTMDENYIGWAGSLASMVAGPENDEAREELDARFCQNDPQIAKHFARVTFLSDNRKDLPKIEIPTLILQSSKDAIADPAVGAYVHQRLPHSKLVEIEATGHAPHMTRPNDVLKAIKEFVSGL